MWTLFIVIALESGDYKYTRLNTYENQSACEISEVIGYVVYKLEDNETLKCIKDNDV